MVQVSLEINGKRVSHEAPARMHLGDFLRDQARLTGTHLGCEHGVCGACTVLLDGQPVRSCIAFAAACEGRRVTTIEGYDGDPVMARLRQAFTRHHALQCGYCTPGMLATARDIVLRLPEADEARVRVELSGNLCRCTGYMGIVAAVMSVLAELREQPDAAVTALREALAQGRGAAPAAATPAPAPTGFQAFAPADP
ncbi:(2Fe-2S)-binding protein, partial [Bordetella petrii]